jgi:hypothetical protein
MVVYDIASAGYKVAGYVAFGGFFILIGIALVVFQRYIIRKWHHTTLTIFPFVFLGFSVLWTTIAFIITYSEYRYLLKARLDGTATVTEGIITNFLPMPYNGHALEKFTVSGVNYSYSDYVVTAGFNNTKSHGGPLDEGKRVRITHIGNVIIKLEVAVVGAEKGSEKGKGPKSCH